MVYMLDSLTIYLQVILSSFCLSHIKSCKLGISVDVGLIFVMDQISDWYAYKYPNVL